MSEPSVCERCGSPTDSGGGDFGEGWLCLDCEIDVLKAGIKKAKASGDEYRADSYTEFLTGCTSRRSFCNEFEGDLNQTIEENPFR